MANTYVAIATTTVGSGGAANIEFTSIPATYTDLVVKTSVRGTTGGTVYIRFNSDSGNNYSNRGLYGTGATVISFSQSSISYVHGGESNTNSDTSNTFDNRETYIPNYTSSNNKSVSTDSVTENNATSVYTMLLAGLWSNSSAISTITLSLSSGNFVQYSTATLYGIKSS